MKYTAPELKAFGTVANLTGMVGPTGYADALYIGTSNMPVAEAANPHGGVPQLDCYFGSGGQYLGIDDGRVNGDNVLDGLFQAECQRVYSNYDGQL